MIAFLTLGKNMISINHKKHYRTIGHKLKPVVTVAGRGLTDSVINEIDRALEDHELIKIKMAISDRQLRQSLTETLCSRLQAELIQGIGKIALIFRKAKKPDARKSNLINV